MKASPLELGLVNLILSVNEHDERTIIRCTSWYDTPSRARPPHFTERRGIAQRSPRSIEPRQGVLTPTAFPAIIARPRAHWCGVPRSVVNAVVVLPRLLLITCQSSNCAAPAHAQYGRQSIHAQVKPSELDINATAAKGSDAMCA